MEPSATKIFNKVLCPVDFDHSLEALDFAIRLAQQNDATLYVLNFILIFITVVLTFIVFAADGITPA